MGKQISRKLGEYLFKRGCTADNVFVIFREISLLFIPVFDEKLRCCVSWDYTENYLILEDNQLKEVTEWNTSYSMVFKNSSLFGQILGEM